MKYLLVTLVLFLVASNVYASATSTQRELIEKYSQKYNINSEYVYATIDCESRFNSKAWNKNDPHGGAKGIGQFLQKTFDRYAKMAKVASPSIWNDEDSIQTMTYMFSKG